MSSFDLPAYLARIGLREAPTADAEGLAAVQRAHRLAIPFENLDVILGRGISLDPDAVFDKLVTAKRGGYCFEQNQLFLRALNALGFEARPLLARVWLGASETPPKTHTLNLVTLDGQHWIADAGFGGSYTPPMPLEEVAEATTSDGAHHRLRADPDHGWMLERHGDARLTDGRGAGHGGWLPQYSFTLASVAAADLALANHWTSTAPGTRFTTLRLASIALPNGFASLTDRHYSRRNIDQANSGEIESAKVYRMRLSLMFGIDLTAEEVDGLGLFDSTPSPAGRGIG
jgi:N-hydroxyarylamine O-acetyltransferase